MWGSWGDGRGSVDGTRTRLRHDDAPWRGTCGSSRCCWRFGLGRGRCGCWLGDGWSRLSCRCRGYWGRRNGWSCSSDWRRRSGWLCGACSGDNRCGCSYGMNCGVGRRCGRMRWCCSDRGTRYDRANGRPGSDGWGRWRGDDIGSLAGQGNDAARRNGGSMWRCRGWRRRRRCCCNSRGDGGCGHGGRRCDNRCGGTRWGGLDGGLGLLALEDCLERVAWLRYLREVELGLCIGGRSVCADAAASAVEIGADLLGLVGLNGAGVRLAGNADGFEGIQNRPALYFQFSCQIVNSNFAHPSLFASLRP